MSDRWSSKRMPISDVPVSEVLAKFTKILNEIEIGFTKGGDTNGESTEETSGEGSKEAREKQ